MDRREKDHDRGRERHRDKDRYDSHRDKNRGRHEKSHYHEKEKRPKSKRNDDHSPSPKCETLKSEPVECVRPRSPVQPCPVETKDTVMPVYYEFGQECKEEKIDATSTVKRRRNRWGGDDQGRVIIPGLPTNIPAGLTADQEKIYLLQLQIEEITRRLRTGELGIPTNPVERSPSPEPIYNNEGKRMNTREVRKRNKLEMERHTLVQEMLKLNPNYNPPPDFKPPQIRFNDKVFIPQDEYPHLNFVGLLIGPRGNTLKQLEKETGAKIIIRGKGSVKDGKLGGKKDGMPLPGEDEPLHAWITAPSEEICAGAFKRISEIITEGIEKPDAENDLRKQQLRELALINGTLRENDGLLKLRQIAEAQTIATNIIICGWCGGSGHLAIDCKSRHPEAYGQLPGSTLLGDVMEETVPPPPPGTEPVNPMVGAATNPPPKNTCTSIVRLGSVVGLSSADKGRMDSEYTALMKELGVKGGPPDAPKYVDRTLGNFRLPFLNASSSAPLLSSTPPAFSRAPPGMPLMTAGPAPPPPPPPGEGPNPAPPRPHFYAGYMPPPMGPIANAGFRTSTGHFSIPYLQSHTAGGKNVPMPPNLGGSWMGGQTFPTGNLGPSLPAMKGGYPLPPFPSPTSNGSAVPPPPPPPPGY